MRIGEVTYSKTIFNAITVNSHIIKEADTTITFTAGVPFFKIEDENVLQILSDDIQVRPMLEDEVHCQVEITAYDEPKEDFFAGLDETTLYIKQIFVKLDNALRYFIGEKEYVDFGVYSYRFKNDSSELNNDLFATTNKVKRSDFKPIDIDQLFENKIANYFLNNVFLRQDTQMKKRIAMSIDWVGQSFFQIDTSVAFVECVFAIEALLQYQEGYVDKGISAQLSEYVAFLIGKDYSSRSAIEKEFKGFYKTRSKIAHGDTNHNDKDSLKRIRGYATTIINGFLENPNLKKIKTPQELRNFIDYKRLS